MVGHYGHLLGTPLLLHCLVTVEERESRRECRIGGYVEVGRRGGSVEQEGMWR